MTSFRRPTTLLCFAFFIIAQSSEAQIIRQCLCSEVAPCKNAYISSLIPCLDHCKAHADTTSVQFDALIGCIENRKQNIVDTVGCIERRYNDSCATEMGNTVSKRYSETFKLAVISDLNRWFIRTKTDHAIRDLFVQGKKFAACVKSCLDRSTGQCDVRLGCGLKLPSDRDIIETAKECAKVNGFDTPDIQRLCQCAVDSGVLILKDACPKLVL